MSLSSIGWTDITWNPGIYGCREVSRACLNCYAAKMAHRLVAMGHYPPGITTKRASGVHWSGHVEVADEPTNLHHLPKKKPARVFVTSMSDLFHPDVPDNFIRAVFMEMKNRPHLTFQVLTKRPERILAFWRAWIEDQAINWPWPSNVWIGCTIEGQDQDDRLLHLVQVPARVRFVSCEPLMGPLDLSLWMRPIAPVLESEAPKTWAEWNEAGLWPDWMPEKWRDHIQNFWGDDLSRGPGQWIQSCHHQGSPPFGARMSDLESISGDLITGRWIHTWNNMGVIVDDEGVAHVSSTPRAGLFDPSARDCASWQGIQWVITGGESGANAQPSHPDWFRSLRDQCARASVPFFFKQWGEWREATRGDLQKTQQSLLIDNTGREKAMTEAFLPDRGMDAAVVRMGTKASGRTLDGETHTEFPRIRR